MQELKDAFTGQASE